MLTLVCPDVFQDPYPFYRRLHAESETQRLLWDDVLGAHLVVRYEDCSAMLRAPGMTSKRIGRVGPEWTDEMRAAIRPISESLMLWALFQDPPDHTRLRALMAKAFTPRIVERMRPRVESEVNRLLDARPKDRPFDLMNDLAHPLPAAVILEMLGVPPQDRASFRGWSSAIARYLGSGGAGMPEMDVVTGARRALDEMRAYLRPLFDLRRIDPRDDLLTSLLNAEIEGDVLSAEELFANCVMLLFAGQETTTHLIGNGVLALMRHPEERARLARDPALAPSAVDELLRFDAPVQFVGRMTTDTTKLAGATLPPDSTVIALLGAANHDPAVFTEPERLDLARKPKHAAFGFGPHFCVGASLARLEAEVAFASLLARFPEMRLASDAAIVRQPTIALRGLASLPLLV